MTQFRPCIDLHQGQVKQIVGGSLKETGATTNFVSQQDAAYYAKLYCQHALVGGHVIALGPGNQEQALAALSAWPGGLQYGGGVTPDNAAVFLQAGASHVIVTSYLFDQGRFSFERLEKMRSETGAEHLVLDLSCRRTAQGWQIATDRWQTLTEMPVNNQILQELGGYCSEFLVHAADVEGLQAGIDEELVQLLAGASTVPVTYAGGARGLADLERVAQLSDGRVDLTIGSALDIFGGRGVTLEQCIQWNRSQPG